MVGLRPSSWPSASLLHLAVPPDGPESLDRYERARSGVGPVAHHPSRRPRGGDQRGLDPDSSADGVLHVLVTPAVGALDPGRFHRRTALRILAVGRRATGVRLAESGLPGSVATDRGLL